MSKPIISIIVPVYKVEKYLNKCVDSVLNQTFTDFELILVDDGSPDKCPKICDDYAQKDNRIVVIHKKNGGLSDARNSGLEIAKGEFIAFLDSDDYAASDMYEKLYKQITENNADMAICNYIHVEETEDGIKELEKYQVPCNKSYNREQFIEELLKEHGGYFVPVWNKLYRKYLFEGLRFPKGKINEDEFVIHHIVQKCNKIICISDKLHYYLHREGSIMTNNNWVKRMDYGEALIDRYHFAKKNKYEQWRKHTAIRLSYEMENWRRAANDSESIKRYNEIRKKALFLIAEKYSWDCSNMKGKLYNRMLLLFPKK
ncbi:MAG: glycosyltransferase family 2 protein [Lachnospiraceae bacterium]|nr:glycosyltransferase family 2 protein [Lachnospiraceae bacterium]